MKQKAINQEYYSFQGFIPNVNLWLFLFALKKSMYDNAACEKALEVVKHEGSNLIIERNEHKKTESLFEIQTRSYNSHLNRLYMVKEF